MCSSTGNISFLDIKDPAKRATLVKEYVAAMKTVRQRNMVNREKKLAIGDELQTLFHPIVNANKQATEEARKELTPMKKTSTDIDGALAAQRATDAPSKPRPGKNVDITFGIYKKQDGQLSMGNKIVWSDGKILVDNKKYKVTPGLEALITQRHPRPGQWNSNDDQVYKSLVAHTKVKSFPSRTRAARPHATWKWKHMLRKMDMPGDRIAAAEEEESEDTDTDSVESYPDFALPGDIGESSDMLSPNTHHHSVPSHLHTCSYGNAKKRRRIENLFYKGYGLLYLPGDINGLVKKLHLLGAEFFAGNTTVSQGSCIGCVA